jgi:ERCC4-type nuclease
MILIDDRAGSRELIKIAPLDKCAELTRLDSADVCMSGLGPHGPISIGVEVKSIFDMISSLSSGRLQGEQIPKMLESGYDTKWLLYYGSYRASPVNGNFQIHKRIKGKVTWTDYVLGKRTIPYSYVEAFLVSPAFTQLGILSKRVIDIEEVVAWLMTLYRTWSKPYDKHKSMNVIYNNVAAGSAGFNPALSVLPRASDKGTQKRARIAASLPGVGYERAMAAAAHFTSVREMINASAEEWALVSGIGKVLGRSIVEAVK